MTESVAGYLDRSVEELQNIMDAFDKLSQSDCISGNRANVAKEYCTYYYSQKSSESVPKKIIAIAEKIKESSKEYLNIYNEFDSMDNYSISEDFLDDEIIRLNNRAEDFINIDEKVNEIIGSVDDIITLIKPDITKYIESTKELTLQLENVKEDVYEYESNHLIKIELIQNQIEELTQHIQNLSIKKNCNQAGVNQNNNDFNSSWYSYDKIKSDLEIILVNQGYTDEEITYLENYPDLLRDFYIANCYSTSDAKVLQEKIYIKTRIYSTGVYAINGTKDKELSQIEKESNAEYIYYYLLDKGWSKESIIGVLGNMQQESKMNPGCWQSQDKMNLGYGILQYSPSGDDPSLFWEYISKYDINTVDEVNAFAVEHPKEMLNYQLDFITDVNNWFSDDVFKKHFDNIKNTKYGDILPAKVQMTFAEYRRLKITPEACALIFHASYMRSNDGPAFIEKRGDYAIEWGDYFENL